MIINGFHYGFIQISMFINGKPVEYCRRLKYFHIHPDSICLSFCLSVRPSVLSSGLSLSIVCYLLQLRYLAIAYADSSTPTSFHFCVPHFHSGKAFRALRKRTNETAGILAIAGYEFSLKKVFFSHLSWDLREFFLLGVSVSMNHFTFEHFQFSFDLPLVEFLVRADLWQRPTIVVFAMAAKGIDAALCCQLV